MKDLGHGLGIQGLGLVGVSGVGSCLSATQNFLTMVVQASLLSASWNTGNACKPPLKHSSSSPHVHNPKARNHPRTQAHNPQAHNPNRAPPNSSDPKPQHHRPTTTQTRSGNQHNVQTASEVWEGSWSSHPSCGCPAWFVWWSWVCVFRVVGGQGVSGCWFGVAGFRVACVRA